MCLQALDQLGAGARISQGKIYRTGTTGLDLVM
jgi:hypothetical protein